MADIAGELRLVENGPAVTDGIPANVPTFYVIQDDEYFVGPFDELSAHAFRGNPALMQRIFLAHKARATLRKSG